MARDRAFLENQREDGGYRPAEERVRDFKPVELGLTAAQARDQAARCMDCGTPFCTPRAAPWGT